jgi:ribosomal protein S18 acetylase RimI-like enzyme
MPSIEIVEADLERADHQDAVIELVDAYAADPMGNGRPLSAETRLELIAGLRQVPTAVIFLAYLEQRAVGIAVCFRGFSTFAARPLINIHDLAVLRAHRGLGVGRRLLEAVERRARDVGCCKLTLEVAENNDRARRIYRAAGFAQAQYASGTGGALFMSKPLQSPERAGFAGQETAGNR